MYFALVVVFARVTGPRISAATLLNDIPKLIVWRGAILFFPAALPAWHKVQFSHFCSWSFLIFGRQNLCIALYIEKVFWKAKSPPMSPQLESLRCSKTVSMRPCGTTSCFCVPVLSSTCHYMYRTPSVSSIWSQRPHIATAFSPWAMAFAFLIFKSLNGF